MKKRTVTGTMSCVVLLIAGSLLAHPHFKKSVSASMKGLDLKLQYVTLPYNESRLKEVTPGFIFQCGRAQLTVEGETTSGDTKVAAGTYLVRAQAKSVDDWTLFLIPEAAGSRKARLE